MYAYNTIILSTVSRIVTTDFVSYYCTAGFMGAPGLDSKRQFPLRGLANAKIDKMQKQAYFYSQTSCHTELDRSLVTFNKSQLDLRISYTSGKRMG